MLQLASRLNLSTCAGLYSCYFYHIFVSPGDAPAIITQYIAWMERQFNACQTPRSMYLSVFYSFRVIRCLSQCVSPIFLPTAGNGWPHNVLRHHCYFYHIFVSPENAPGAITLNVVWMEGEFDAYKLSCCMCPSPESARVVC